MPPILTTSNDTVVCPNQGVYLWVQPIDVTQYYTYMWNGNQVDSNFYITPEIVEDTVFYIVVTDECNLTATDSINANIYTEPVIEILTDSIYGCVPHAQKYLVNISQNTILGAIEWQTAIGYINSSDNNAISIGYSYPGNDQLSANFTSANGCNYNVDFDTYIHISSTPIANFSFLPTIPNNYDEVISFKNESKDYIESNWTIGTQLFSTIDAELVIGTINDIYRPFNACLKVSNDENCSAEICQLITIESDQLIFVPNSFTPGSGEYNSIFKVDGTNVDIYGFHMVIFNRWGEIVFESFDIDSGWDGTYAGNVLETAVFTWKIDVALKSDPKKVNNLVGQVTLLR